MEKKGSFQDSVSDYAWILPTNLSDLFSQLIWQNWPVILTLYRNKPQWSEKGRRKLASQNEVLEMEDTSWEGWFLMKNKNDKTKDNCPGTVLHGHFI